jgi:hypothetical protein
MSPSVSPMPPADRPARIAWFGHDWGIACAREPLTHGRRIVEIFTDDLAAPWVREARAPGNSLGVPATGRRPTARPWSV